MKNDIIRWESNENGVAAITEGIQEEIDMEVLRIIREEQLKNKND